MSSYIYRELTKEELVEFFNPTTSPSRRRILSEIKVNHEQELLAIQNEFLSKSNGIEQNRSKDHQDGATQNQMTHLGYSPSQSLLKKRRLESPTSTRTLHGQSYDNKQTNITHEIQARLLNYFTDSY
jgi:hypothetical protein